MCTLTLYAQKFLEISGKDLFVLFVRKTQPQDVLDFVSYVPHGVIASEEYLFLAVEVYVFFGLFV